MSSFSPNNFYTSIILKRKATFHTLTFHFFTLSYIFVRLPEAVLILKMYLNDYIVARNNID